MWAERNAEDDRLLAAGDHATLLATYYDIIVGRCLARLRNESDAYEVAHRVIERLIGELHRGRTYTVPYSVVVNKVVNWKMVEFFAGDGESPLPEDWDAGDPVDPYAEFEGDFDLEATFAPLPERTREVLDLYYRRGLEPAQIGETLGMDRNAVYQRLHQGHARLREAFRDGS
jgi:RNA polymerase sigma factor (sigma-70 family)